MKIIDFNQHNHEPYAEEGQPNPLRWINLKHVKDDEFIPVSKRWKCKDFLNDAVCAYHHKKTYKIYGFECDPYKFFNYHWEGMPILLLNVTDQWIHNIEKVINPYLKKVGMPILEPKKINEGWFVNIPQAYMSNTLGISAITLFIRMANVDVACTTFEGLSKVPLNAHDLSYYKAAMDKPFNKFPEKYKDYLYVYPNGEGVKRNGVVTMVGQMHNCGVYRWGWA
jgi:hypothetical protein